MASLSDHIRRDGEHAARVFIGVELARYRRRMEELAKAHVKEAIEDATTRGESVDGTELGKAAADLAIRAYIGGGEPQPAIDSTAVPALDAAAA